MHGCYDNLSFAARFCGLIRAPPPQEGQTCTQNRREMTGKSKVLVIADKTQRNVSKNPNELQVAAVGKM